MGAFIYKPLLYCYIVLTALAPTNIVGNTAPHGEMPKSGGLCDSRLGAGRVGFSPRSISSNNKPHPIHVSTSNIEYNKADGKLEVICTIFTDDFEAALAKQYKAKTDLNKPEMHAAMDALIKSYIAANLNIKADNVTVNLNYLGFEINREATDVYLESEKMPLMKKVDVEASLLYNLFDDQINIVHVIVNGVRKSEKVDYPDKKVEQVF
jgi:hypothetical protein